jgi:hypothetical protein
MGKGTALWTMFLVLGALFWLASVGVGRHPAYVFCLMVVAFSWFSHTASAQK